MIVTPDIRNKYDMQMLTNDYACNKRSNWKWTDLWRVHIQWLTPRFSRGVLSAPSVFNSRVRSSTSNCVLTCQFFLWMLQCIQLSSQQPSAARFELQPAATMHQRRLALQSLPAIPDG